MKKAHAAAIILIALLAVSLYLSESSEPRQSIFTESLGDMTLARYETGDIAAQQISGIYGLKDIPYTRTYSALYWGRNGTMRVWVVEPENHNIADAAFNSMNSMLGASTGHEQHEFSTDASQTESHENHENAGIMNSTFTKPEKVDILDFLKPDVYAMQANSLYNYYYLKMDYRMGRVYWIAFDYPDPDYQKAMVRQAILNI